MNPEDFDYESHDMIEELVDTGVLEVGTPAYGIAQQAIDKGYDSLSQTQRYIYDTVVHPALRKLADAREVKRIIDSNPD